MIIKTENEVNINWDIVPHENKIWKKNHLVLIQMWDNWSFVY